MEEKEIEEALQFIKTEIDNIMSSLYNRLKNSYPENIIKEALIKYQNNIIKEYEQLSLPKMLNHIFDK